MEEIVHIIPMGYEVDRAVKPLEKMKANRAYLLYTQEGMARKSVRSLLFLSSAKEKLERLGVEVIVREGDPSDPLPLLSTISDIIVREKRAQNIVYVNMSSAGKLAAVSATLAAMYHNVKVYYVHTDGGFYKSRKDFLEHGFSMVNIPTYTILTNFTIDMPSCAKSAFLVELYKKATSRWKKRAGKGSSPLRIRANTQPASSANEIKCSKPNKSTKTSIRALNLFCALSIRALYPFCGLPLSKSL